MARRLLLLVLLAFGFQSEAFSQTAAPAPSAVSVEVQGLAPQLVDFAGSAQNFQSLVNGLAGGIPVTLVTPLADGTTQTTTFTPNGILDSAQIAQTLEAAREQLISRGISAPTAQQIGVTLTGGSLPTVAGDVQVTGLVPVTPATMSAAAVTPSVITLSPAAAATARNVPATGFGATPLGAAPATTAADTSASTGSSATTTTTTSTPPPPRFTSDTPTLHSISETPTPSIGVPFNPAAPNGLPSPAIQIQQRR